MASHLSDIGFPVMNQDEVIQLAMHAAEHGTPHATPLGDYRVWAPGEGVELWVHLNANGEITQLHPHYTGTSRMLCRVTEALLDPEYPLEGSVTGWACVTPEAPDTGVYPVTVNIPNYCQHFHGVDLPVTLPLQIAAFAQQVTYFADDAAFQALQAPQGLAFTMAAESYVPIGGPNGFFAADDDAPAAESVLMSGHIVTCQRHNNPATGEPFFAMTLRVQEGTFDVVADARLFPDTTPVPGGILEGTFWLSARVLGN